MNEDILLGLKLAITNTEQELTNEIDSLVTAAQKKAKAVQLDLNIDEGLKKLEKTLNGKLKGVNFNPELKKFFEAFSSGDIKDIGKAYEEINNKALLLTKTLTDAQLKLMDGWSGEQVNKFVKKIIKANEEIEKATRKQSKYENIPEYVKKTRASENSIKKTLQGKKNKSDEEILDQFERAGLDVSKITKKELSSFTYYEKLLSYQKELIENDKALANPKTQKEADAQIENAQKLIKVTELLGRSREQLIEIGKKLNQNEDFTIDEVQSIDPNLATKYAQEWNKIVDKAIAEIRRNINSNLAEELEETSSKYLSAKVERNTIAINQQRAKRAKAIAPVDKEDVGTIEQYTEALNGVDNELDDVQEGATTTAKSVEQLGEEFKEVKKYAVEAEEAIAKLRILETIKDEDGHRIEDLDDSQIKDIIGYYTRLRSLNDIDKLNEPFLSIFNNIDDNYTDLIFEAFDNLDLISPGKTDQFTALIEAMTQKQFEAINEYEEQTVKKAQEAQEHVAEEISKPIKEVVEDTAIGNGEEVTIPISIDVEDIKKQLQETIADFDTKFSDALNNSINEFSDRFSNIDYYQALEPLRRELLNIVQQFKNSLKDLGIENSDLNKLYETLDAWNTSSHISTEDDRERLMLGNIKSGKTSVAVSGSEASISGELQQRLLTEVSKRIDGNISDVFDMWIHSHPLRDFLPNSKTRTTGADIGFSYGDLQSELNHYFEQGIKKMLVTNNGKYSMLDFSKISKEILEKFISQLAANLEKSGNFSIETDKIFKDGKGKIKDVAINKDAYVKDGVADLDKKSELINNAILETINSSKELKQIIFETGDIADLKIDEVVQDEKNLANQSEELLNILNQIRNILNDMSTSGGGNSNLSGIFNIHLIADVDYLIERIQRTLDDHDFKIKVNLTSGQPLDESDEGAINTEGFSADRATDSLHALNYEKSENIELNTKLRKNANESAKALANEAEKAEAADKALTELNKRKRANNKLNEEKSEETSKEDSIELDSTVKGEATTLSSLIEPLNNIKAAIAEKNKAFIGEEEVVKEVTTSEFDHLGLVYDVINEISQAIENLNKKFGDLSLGQLNELIKKFRSNKTNNATIDGIVENLTKLADRLNTLKIDDSGIIDSITRIVDASKQLKDAVKDAETINKAVKKSGGKTKKEKDPAASLIKELSKKNNDILKLNNKKQTSGLTIDEEGKLATLVQQYNRLQQQIEAIGITTNEATKAYQKFKEAAQDAATGLEASNAKAQSNELESQRKQLDKLEKKAKEVYENIDKYREGFRNNLKGIASKSIDLDNIDEIKARIKELTESLDDKSLKENLEGTYTKLLNYYEKIQKTLASEPNMAPTIKQKYRALANEIDNLVKSGDVLPGVLNRITKAFIDLNAEDAKTKGFFRAVADRTREMNVKFLGQFFSFYDIIRYGREVFNVIKELDTSLVDLRKTTAMTAKELDEFYYESNKIARQMGVTTNEIITQASAWSRLGYNTAEATKQMAQLSSKFASISPGMDVDKAQEGLVSIMKAWDIETDEAERKILDNINTLGNKFAETNADIVTGMEKSAATFAALEQSAEDAFALFTGAQEVMQNAEVVGTALKTLSLRIRGYDEETEELSEDLVNLKGKVVDLTKTAKHTQGVSLFTDASQTHYKSMVQYLGEIAEIWDEIDEKSRTELLDKLFGKRGASVGSAIIGNFDQVKKALAEMETAAGSAESEMDIIRDSVEFKLNELKNVWIGYIQQLLQREDIGEIIDQLIEGSESLQSVIDAATPLIHDFIELLSDLLGVLADIAKSSDMAIPALGGLLAFNGINNKLELFKVLGNKKVFDGMSSAIKGTALEASGLTKSFISLSSLLTSPGFWGLAGVAAFSAALYKLYKSEEEIYKQAQEATKEYDNREKSLEKYKTKIIELRKTADDSTLSIEEQQKAREELLSIQSEMVDQFGAEAANVDILRDSIDRLNDSFDTLSESSYQEFLNSVNRNEGWDGFWHKLRTGEMFDPSVSNATYIQDQMENASSQLFGNVDVSTKGQQKLAKLFNERGFNVKYNEGMGEYYMSPANLQDYYDTLLDIQIKYRNNQEEIGVSTYKELSKEVERVNKILTSISPTYNEMLEHDTIMPKYQDTVNKLKTAMSDIYNARVAEDEKGVDEASKRLTQIYDDFLKTVDDPAIINWFEKYVAEYEAIMNKTRFTEGLNNNANYQIAKTNNKKYGYSKEELEAAANMDDEAINNIADIHKRVIVQRIKMAAHDAEIPVSVVIDQLEADKAAINGLERQLRDKFGDFKIDSLSPEDLEIVLNLSGALNMKWEDIQNEIFKAKKQMKEMSKIQMIDSLNDMSSGFDKLDEVYADVYDKGSFDFTKLASKKFEEAFAGLDAEVYSKFIETVSEYPDDLEKTQEAFNELAQAYIEHEGILEGLTEENKNVATQMLKNMGIANAEEVVTASLAQAQEDLKLEKEYVETASEQLADATVGEINAFIDEKNYSEQAKDALVVLALQKQLVNGTTLDFSGDIQNIINYITELGGATSALKRLQAAKSGANLSDQGYSGSMDEKSRKKYLAQLEKDAQAEVDSILNEYKNKKVPQVQYNGGDKTRDAKDKAAKSAAEDAELFDWIETKIQRLEREITNLGKTADATFKTWAERTIALGQEMGKVNEQISLQQTAYATYLKQAEAIDLAQEYKDKVMNGTLDVESISDKTLKKNIKDFKEVYEKALAAKDKVDDLQSSLANLAKTKFDNITSQFDDIISDVEHMTKYITAQLESVETVGKIAGKSFYEAQIAQEQERLNDLTQELGQLQTALAEGLASGAIAYGSQMFNEMKKSIYSVEESILDANNAILKFEQSIKQVAKANFDDLKSQFESAISILTDKIDLTDKIVNMVQATGHIASKAYYDALITGTDQNIQNLKKKYDELSKVFNDAVASGDVKEFSDEWYDMKSGIEAVKGEIIDATNSLIEYKNALRQIEWDLFDRGQTRLEQLVSESQFLIDLYEKYPLFDKETGDITSKGMATRGLLVQNYETYIQQAALLADEIERLKSELKADPKNTTLIDRLRELEEQERSALLSSEAIKESLRDLLQNEINALIDALEKLINKYTEALNRQKD